MTTYWVETEVQKAFFELVKTSVCWRPDVVWYGWMKFEVESEQHLVVGVCRGESGNAGCLLTSANSW